MPGVGRRTSPGCRLADVLEALTARLWPAPLHRFAGWLPLLPALLSVGLLAAGLAHVADFSLRELAPDTYRLAESYSLVDYHFVANAIYDAFFQISDAGLGSALAMILVLLGSTIVAALFAVLGAGTMSFLPKRSG